jgi:hypothetical protein
MSRGHANRVMVAMPAIGVLISLRRSDVAQLRRSFGYLLATWKENAQRADAGNPLILLVSALGLEPMTL